MISNGGRITRTIWPNVLNHGWLNKTRVLLVNFYSGVPTEPRNNLTTDLQKWLMLKQKMN